MTASLQLTVQYEAIGREEFPLPEGKIALPISPRTMAPCNDGYPFVLQLTLQYEAIGRDEFPPPEGKISLFPSPQYLVTMTAP